MAQPSAADSLGIGTVIADTYEVVGLIGRGGMGAVWEAQHRRLPGKSVAVKVLLDGAAAGDEALARFRREAEIASRLGHPNIVQVHDFNVLDDGTPYLILERLVGEALSDRIARGPLPWAEAASTLRQVASALRAAHEQGVVHRDLKPHNIFLTPTDSGGRVAYQAKVLDFGISKIRGSQTVQTQTQALLGTPQYMAPEQATGRHDEVDQRTDVFALGAIAYEMLAGQPAFTGSSVPEVVFRVVYEEPPPLGPRIGDDVPQGVTEAIQRALEKEREKRFQDVAALAEALTGEPLASLSRVAPEASALGETVASDSQKSGGAARSGNERVRSTEAVAATAGPAAAGPAESAGMAATGWAPTPTKGPAVEAAATASGADPASLPRGRRGLAMAIAGALLGAGVAILGVALITSDGRTSEAAASAAAATPTPADASTIAEAEAADAAPARSAAEAADAGATRADASARPEPTPPRRRPRRERASAEPPRADETAPERTDATERALPDEVLRDLKAARAALSAGDPNRALFLVGRAQRERTSGRGFALEARAYCTLQDLGNARAAYLNVPERLRERVRSSCRERGVELR